MANVELPRHEPRHPRERLGVARALQARAPAPPAHAPRRARACGLMRYPPSHGCPWCPSQEWTLAGGDRAGATSTPTRWSHHAIQPGFKDWTPYAVVLVELDEQRGQPTADEALRVIGNLVTAGRAAPEPEVNVAIGKRVRAVFHDLARGLRPAPVHAHRRASRRESLAIPQLA